MSVRHSPADSPFAWVAYDGADVALAQPRLPPAPRDRAFYLPSRNIDSLAIHVSVVEEGIRVVERSSGALVRAIRFTQGFPLGRRLRFPYSDCIQAVIADEGSIVFLAGLDLYLWRFLDGHVQKVAALDREPEHMVISHGVRRLATLISPYGNKESEWIAQVWSLPDGERLAELHWSPLYNGSFDFFSFSADGSQLFLSTDVCAQSGSDFTEDHTWDIDTRPEHHES